MASRDNPDLGGDSAELPTKNELDGVRGSIAVFALVAPCSMPVSSGTTVEIPRTFQCSTLEDGSQLEDAGHGYRIVRFEIL